MYDSINSFIAGLPVANFYDAIMNSDAKYIIVEAETGSGKTVAVPNWFLQMGLSVIVTEPLIETVLGTTEFICNDIMNIPVGDHIGYATGDYKKFSSETRLLYCTDGLALVRELNTGNRFDILVIDELHVWNTNQSTLEAWAWKHVLDGNSPFQKVIVLSATLDSESLSKKRNNAPIFKVPGRTFEIVSREPGESVVDDVKSLVAEDSDVLVFQPGKAEIEATIKALVDAKVDAELIPFHGQLERSDKNRAYRDYSRPKVIVSTNSLETGRTVLPSKVNGAYRTLAVVDSGMERRIEIESGVETLVLRGISKANSAQRRGRTGRVGKGIYIDHCRDRERTAYPVPEIQRTLLDQTVLRLAVAGYDATELPFFYDIEEKVLQDAKATLVALGFLTKDGKVTRDGFTASKLPVGVKIARMVLEAANRGVVDDVLTIAAIMETGSLKARAPRGEEPKWKYITSEHESDLLAELDLYDQAEKLDKAYWNDAGIFAANYFKAKQLRLKLSQALCLLVKMENGGKRVDILKSVAAGMVDHLYHQYGRSRFGYDYKNGESGYRRIDQNSVVPDGTDWVVGMPFDLEIETRRGKMTLNLITWVTKVDPIWLVEVAPQLASTELRNYRFDRAKNAIICDEVKVFNGQDIATTVVEGEGPNAVLALVKAFLVSSPFGGVGKVDHPDHKLNKAIISEIEGLDQRSGHKLGTIPNEKLVEFYVSQLGEVYQVEKALEIDLRLTDEDISFILGVDFSAKRKEIRRQYPDFWTIKEVVYEIKYVSQSSFSGIGDHAKIHLPLRLVESINDSDLPSWTDVRLFVYLTDEGLNFGNIHVDLSRESIRDLLVKIESIRQKSAWDVFVYDRRSDQDSKVMVHYNDPLPKLPDPKVWDTKLGTLAYASWVYQIFGRTADGKSEWHLNWFQTKEEAEEARKKSRAKKDEIVVKNNPS